MPRLLRRILTIIVLVAIIAAVAWAFMPQPIMVDAARVDRGPLRVTVDEDGETRIKERFVISSPLGGRLQRIELDPGDQVQADQTVVSVIEPTDPSLLDVRERTEAQARVRAAEAAVRRAEAMVVRAEETLGFQQRERERVSQAALKEAALQREVDEKNLAVRTAEQELRSAEFAREIATFELEQARSALLRTDPASADSAAHFPIHSPITGSVLRVFQESMAVVVAGAPLIELGDPADLEVVVDVLSTDAAKIHPGMPVVFDGWGGPHALSGEVRLVEPAAFTKISALGVEEQRVNVIIDLLTAPADRPTLGDAYRVEAHIVLWESDDVLKLPTSALHRRSGKWSVFVIERGRAARREVELGQNNGLEAEVLGGLNAGDIVIVHPSDAVRDQSRVEPREAE